MCLVLIEAEAITYKRRPEAKDPWHTVNVFGAIESEAITYKRRPEAKDPGHTGNVFGANRS